VRARLCELRFWEKIFCVAEERERLDVGFLPATLKHQEKHSTDTLVVPNPVVSSRSKPETALSQPAVKESLMCTALFVARSLYQRYPGRKTQPILLRPMASSHCTKKNSPISVNSSAAANPKRSPLRRRGLEGNCAAVHFGDSASPSQKREHYKRYHIRSGRARPGTTSPSPRSTRLQIAPPSETPAVLLGCTGLYWPCLGPKEKKHLPTHRADSA